MVFGGGRGAYGPVSADGKPFIATEEEGEAGKREGVHALNRRTLFALTGVLLVSALASLAVVHFGRATSSEAGPVQTSVEAQELPLVGLRAHHSSHRHHSDPKSLTGDNWWLKKFHPKDIAENMLYTDCKGKTATGAMMPAQFGGLWWMDGNPAPETVASFGHARWEYGKAACEKTEMRSYTAEERKKNIVEGPFGDKVPCQGRMIVEFAEDRIWAMPDTSVARTYEQGGTAIRSTMEFVCGGKHRTHLTICKVGSNTGPKANDTIGSIVQGIKGIADQSFNYLARFSMVQVNADYWVRYSLDGVYPYHLKRIIGCDGKPVKKHWEQFLSNGKAKPEVLKDVYGHGGDNRSHVAKVHDELFIRWNTDPKPKGSGFVCVQETGGRCRVLGCSRWRQAVCSKDHHCMCAKNKCRNKEGKCIAKPHSHHHR